MLSSSSVPKETVCLLADHLDAALAAGEDLQSTRLEPLATHDGDVDAEDAALAKFVARLGRLEAALLGRIMQARRRVGELPGRDTVIRPLAQLFMGSTDIVLGLVERLGDKAQARFESGHERLPFLRGRGVIAADAPTIDPESPIEIGESYKIAGVIELGPLMDMISGLLTALDARYDLYGDVQSDIAADSAAQPAQDSNEDLAALIQRVKTEAAVDISPADALAAPAIDEEPVTADSLMAAIEKLEATPTPVEPVETKV